MDLLSINKKQFGEILGYNTKMWRGPSLVPRLSPLLSGESLGMRLVRANEIARLLITLHFPYSSEFFCVPTESPNSLSG